MSVEKKLKFKAGEVICVQGENKHDMYQTITGKLMVCTVKGREVTPLAYIGPGEFVGEMSFFDEKPRSAFVMAVEDSDVLEIPHEKFKAQFPPWLVQVAQTLTQRIRHVDEIIKEHGLRRKNVTSVGPISLEEQRHYYQILEPYL